MPAREEILSDLRLDSPRLHVNVLLSLPDKYLPQLELHFADRARHNPWLFGRLAGKYGSSKILPAMRSVYDAGHLHWGCDSRIGFLGYFLRFAPGDEARDILRGAILEREGNGCYRSFFTALRQVPWAPMPMGVAIEFLDDPDAEVAIDAAILLKESATSEARNALQARHARWKAEWSGRESGLRGNPATGEGGNSAQFKLGRLLSAED
jgi:hypothetical protein